jgi:hypothetical protein
VDDVTQFCVEEALSEMVEYRELLSRSRGAMQAGSEPGDPERMAAEEAARRFARGE